MESIAWRTLYANSNVYGDYLYICSNSGILTCYQATTGEQVYKKRLRMKGLKSFVGSPIASDGHVYITSEDGENSRNKSWPENLSWSATIFVAKVA